MSGYENGKIYKVVNEGDDIIYIGSTKNTLKIRWKDHHLKCDEYKIVLIENYPCVNRTELRKMEQKFINIYIEMGLLNLYNAYQSKEERIEYLKSDKIKAYQKEYNKSDKNKAYQKEYQKEYRKDDEHKAYKKEYNKSVKMKEYRKIKENCQYCKKLMLKKNIKTHIKNWCKMKPVDL